MKKLIFPIVILFMTNAMFCQNNSEIIITPEKQHRKGKFKNQEAWLLLLSGVAVLVFVAIPSLDCGDEDDPCPVIPMAIGGAMVVGGITLFISSADKKNKPVTLSLKKEAFPMIVSNKALHNKAPSVSVSILF